MTGDRETLYITEIRIASLEISNLVCNSIPVWAWVSGGRLSRVLMTHQWLGGGKITARYKLESHFKFDVIKEVIFSFIFKNLWFCSIGNMKTVSEWEQPVWNFIAIEHVTYYWVSSNLVLSRLPYQSRWVFSPEVLPHLPLVPISWLPSWGG